MGHYRIAAHGRTYYCDAPDIAAALRHFHDNVEGADARTIIEVRQTVGETKAESGQTKSLTKPPRNTRRSTRR